MTGKPAPSRVVGQFEIGFEGPSSQGILEGCVTAADVKRERVITEKAGRTEFVDV